MVAAIENLTGDKAVYMRMPTCAYEIGDITVDKEGGLTCDDADKLERLIHNLIADGFTPEDTEEDEVTTKAIGLTIRPPTRQGGGRKPLPTSSPPRSASSRRHSALTTLTLRCQRIRSASLGSQRCPIQKRSKPIPTSFRSWQNEQRFEAYQRQ